MSAISIFSTPIWISEYPNFNEYKSNLLNIVHDFIENNQSLVESGSSSPSIDCKKFPKTIQNEKKLKPVFEYISLMVYQSFSDLDFTDCHLAITSAWLNVNDSRKCMQSTHVHDEVISGIFYLKAPKGSGNLVFLNTSLNPLWKGLEFIKLKNHFNSQMTKIEPKEGEILIFPSYIPHYVESNDHDEQTISIGFEILPLRNQISSNAESENNSNIMHWDD